MSAIAAGELDHLGRRSAARLYAVQALYQIDQSSDDPEVVIDQFVAHRLGREVDGDQYRRPDAKLFAELVLGVSARRAEIDDVIAGSLSKQRPVGRLEIILYWLEHRQRRTGARLHGDAEADSASLGHVKT